MRIGTRYSPSLRFDVRPHRRAPDWLLGRTRHFGLDDTGFKRQRCSCVLNICIVTSHDVNQRL